MPRSRDLNIDRDIFDTVAKTRAPSLEPETGWYKIGPSETYGISFDNSWGNVGVLAGVTNAPASFYLSADGEVRMRGKIDGGSTGTVAFVLPDEVRPEYAETFICAVDGGGSANVTVHPNGEVIVDSIS
jgi:hypothetical protein